MQIILHHKNSRSALIEIADGGIFHTKKSYDIILNGELFCKSDTVAVGLFGLKPDTGYLLEIDGQSLSFRTDYEFVTLDVKDFGAAGDGVRDDTVFIQAAITACPKDSRVLIPPGEYKISNLFLKSDCRIELAKGARLSAYTERERHPIFPGMLESYDEKSEYNLGTWEGNPLPMYAAILTGLHISNAEIYGEGIIDGNADETNWWRDIKNMQGAWRPRLAFFSHCDNIRIFGAEFCNSPAWNIHMYFSRNIELLALTVKNPMDSPNTDGVDIESCEDVKIFGSYFSLGDDCVALKSGKIYMARKYRTATRRVRIYQCLMERGHGAVTIGSEMAAGVTDVEVTSCLFAKTDRGLRIKTRRGRGELAVADNISFSDIEMDGVGTPFVVNCFYFCDPDGKSEYVQSREALPVDERTPNIRRLSFSRIKCRNTHAAAAYFMGLPERKIEAIMMEDIFVSFAPNAKAAEPDMHSGVARLCRSGVHALNVERLELRRVIIAGCEGEKYILENVNFSDIVESEGF